MFIVAGVPRLKISKEVIPVSSIAVNEERGSDQRVVKSSKVSEVPSGVVTLSAEHDQQEQSHLSSSKPGEDGLSQSGGVDDDALRIIDIVSSSGSGEGDTECTPQQQACLKCSCSFFKYADTEEPMVSQHEAAAATKKPLELWPCGSQRSSERGKVATSTRASITTEEGGGTRDRLSRPLTVSGAQIPHGMELEISSDSVVYPQHSLTPHQHSRRQDDEEVDKETQTTSQDGSKLDPSHPSFLDHASSPNRQAESSHQRAGKNRGLRSSLRRDAETQTDAILPDHTRSHNRQAKSPRQRAGKSPRSSRRQDSLTQTDATLPDHLARIVQGYWTQLALKKALQ